MGVYAHSVERISRSEQWCSAQAKSMPLHAQAEGDSLEAARTNLYRDIDEAEADFAAGRVREAGEFIEGLRASFRI